MASCIGVDLHLRTATFCHLLEGQGRCLRTLRVHSTHWRELWDSVPPQSDVFLEMSQTTWWFVRWIQERGHEVHVIDPAWSRAMAACWPKTDHRDARWLAEMGAKGVLYVVYVIHPRTEHLHELIWHRALWVRDRTRVKNRIHYQLAREQLPFPYRSPFSKRGWQWLAAQSLPAPYSASLANHRTHYEFVQQKVEEATERVLTAEFDGHPVSLLASIPGIGEFAACTLLAEIEAIYRFPDPKELISYASFAPRVRQRGSMDWRGNLTKRGSICLRTPLIESAQVAVRQPNQFQRVFRRVAFHRGHNVGIVAAARAAAMPAAAEDF